MLSGDPGTIRPTYVFEVLEGEVDKGADVSELSFYPHEKEKLYGPLVSFAARNGSAACIHNRIAAIYGSTAAIFSSAVCINGSAPVADNAHKAPFSTRPFAA